MHWREEEKWVEGIIIPKPPRRAGKDNNSLSEGPKVVTAGRKQ